MVIGLAAATLGLFGNLLVAFFSSMNSQRIEQFKAQSNLIVQAVGTGDQKSACRNLISFIRLGLLKTLRGDWTMRNRFEYDTGVTVGLYLHSASGYAVGGRDGARCKCGRAVAG